MDRCNQPVLRVRDMYAPTKLQRREITFSRITYHTVGPLTAIESGAGRAVTPL